MWESPLPGAGAGGGFSFGTRRLREGAGEEGWRPSRGDMRRGFLSYAGSSDRSVENVVKRLSEFGFRGKR